MLEKVERRKRKMLNSVAVVTPIFCGELGNFPAAAKSQPVVPRFAQTVARGLVLLIQFVAFEDLGENSSHRKIVRVDDRVSRPNSSGVMRIAGGGHGQTADLCVFES